MLKKDQLQLVTSPAEITNKDIPVLVNEAAEIQDLAERLRVVVEDLRNLSREFDGHLSTSLSETSQLEVFAIDDKGERIADYEAAPGFRAVIKIEKNGEKTVISETLYPLADLVGQPDVSEDYHRLLDSKVSAGEFIVDTLRQDMRANAVKPASSRVLSRILSLFS